MTLHMFMASNTLRLHQGAVCMRCCVYKVYRGHLVFMIAPSALRIDQISDLLAYRSMLSLPPPCHTLEPCFVSYARGVCSSL